MKAINEVITAQEALRRVGLDSLATDLFADGHVDWTGIPVAFSCGHTRKGEHGTERVSQAYCGGGNILYGWTLVGGVSTDRPFHLNHSLVVVVSTRNGDTTLRACITA